MMSDNYIRAYINAGQERDHMAVDASDALEGPDRCMSCSYTEDGVVYKYCEPCYRARRDAVFANSDTQGGIDDE